MSFLINTVQACTINSDQIKEKHKNDFFFSASVDFFLNLPM